MTAASETVEIRDVRSVDAAELADLLNAIIAAGGTTALETPFSPEALDRDYLTGPDVASCVVAVDRETGALLGFQTIGRYSDNPADVIDIATFARIGAKQRGIGRSLFAETRRRAAALGYAQIDATIRGDNVEGLGFYARVGFVDHGITPAVPLADGRPVDRIHKRFDLAGPALDGALDAARSTRAVPA